MWQSILVPLDGSAFGEHALPLALSLARRSGATLHLAHVVPAGRSPGAAEQAARQATYLDGIARLLGDAGVAVRTAVLGGGVVDALVEQTRASGSELVVMTTHGRGALSRLWLGSIADSLVRRSIVPVLLIRPHEETLDLFVAGGERVCRHVLVPLDGSARAEAMIGLAVRLGDTMGAEYTLLRVVDPSAVGASPADPATDIALLNPLRARAQVYLDRHAERLRAAGHRVLTVVMVGSPAGAILSFARTHAVDLIAIETHGRGGFSRLLLGSVADKVLRGASVPLLIRSAGVEQDAGEPGR